MEFSKELKEKLNNVKSTEEAKDVFAKAGILLSDEELNAISGGNDANFDWKLAEERAKKMAEEMLGGYCIDSGGWPTAPYIMP